MYISVKWRRFIPTARAIPISDLRSAASITNVKNISIRPAAIEKSPKIMKNATNTDPTSEPIAASSFLSSTTSSGIPRVSIFEAVISLTAPTISRSLRLPPSTEITMIFGPSLLERFSALDRGIITPPPGFEPGPAWSLEVSPLSFTI